MSKATKHIIILLLGSMPFWGCANLGPRFGSRWARSPRVGASASGPVLLCMQHGPAQRKAYTCKQLWDGKGPRNVVIEAGGRMAHINIRVAPTPAVAAKLEPEAKGVVQGGPAPTSEPTAHSELETNARPPSPPMPSQLEMPLLPARLTVVAFTSNGRRQGEIRAVCAGVEKTIEKDLNRSAAGQTKALEDFLYRHTLVDHPVMLYPRAMAYVIALGLATKKTDLQSVLVDLQRTGKLASLARNDWRPPEAYLWGSRAAE